MTLRRALRPLRPDLDKFLFAAVRDDIDGIPLSTISALTRLGLDPWQEAGRLSSLPRREAVEQVGRDGPQKCRQPCEIQPASGTFPATDRKGRPFRGAPNGFYTPSTRRGGSRIAPAPGRP
jgi:hypothetical protein